MNMDIPLCSSDEPHCRMALWTELKMRLALSWTGLDVEPSPETAELAMKQAVSISLTADLASMVDVVG
jgi:hypothetical protein